MNVLRLTPSDARALIEPATQQVLTYRDLLGRADGLVAVLGQEKQLIFLLSRNDAFTATVFVAALIGGHAIALLDGSRDATTHHQLIAAYAPAWVIGGYGTAEKVATAGMEVADRLDGFGGDLLRMRPGPTGPIHPDLSVLLSTSGTTGSSKLVRLSRTNIESNAAAIASYLSLGPAERAVTSLPLHYTFGLSVMTSHLLAGASVVLTGDSVVQGSFWDTVKSTRCTTMAGVPYTFQILERIGYRDMELPDLVVMQQAGGALDRRLTEVYADHMAAKGGRFFVMYGQTEATARMAYVPPEQLATHIGSAGIAIPGGLIRIGDEAPESRAGQLVGEVIYEGPNVMMGYATTRTDLGAGDELGGVLRTGDIGYLDGNGYLYLVGRSKRIAKVFGLRVNLDEVERMLEESGSVAVVGGDDVIWAFCAFGTHESLDRMSRDLATRLRLHHSSLRLRRVEDLPTSSAGKVDYREVERWTLS